LAFYPQLLLIQFTFPHLSKIDYIHDFLTFLKTSLISSTNSQLLPLSLLLYIIKGCKTNLENYVNS